MYKKILVPIDFSSESAGAVDTAVMLAKSTSAHVRLLNIIEDQYSSAFRSLGIGPSAEHDAVINQLKSKIGEKLGTLTSNIADKGVQIDATVEVGNVFSTISDYINKNDIDLVIMGSKGVSGIEEVLVGSTTEKVVKYVSCPVITVKEKADLAHIKSIVYPTDLKEEQEVVLNDIKELQKQHNANLHLVKVYDSEFIEEREIEDKLEKFAQHFKLESYTVTALRHADEAEAILQFAHNNEASLIAMATHFRKGMEVLFNTRISKNVVNHAKRPIWTKRVN